MIILANGLYQERGSTFVNFHFMRFIIHSCLSANSTDLHVCAEIGEQKGSRFAYATTDEHIALNNLNTPASLDILKAANLKHRHDPGISTTFHATR